MRPPLWDAEELVWTQKETDQAMGTNERGTTKKKNGGRKEEACTNGEFKLVEQAAASRVT